MKKRLLLLVLLILSLTGIFSGVMHYFYFLPNSIDNLLKENISLSLTFLGSIGTLTSIIFAVYVYLDQEDQNRKKTVHLIKNSKPIFQLNIREFDYGFDSNNQPAIIMDILLVNYSHTASSVSLSYESTGSSNLIVSFDLPLGMELINKGENRNISASIIYSSIVNQHPKISDINLMIKIIYLDNYNNAIEDCFKINPQQNKPYRYQTSNSTALTSNGSLLEL